MEKILMVYIGMMSKLVLKTLVVPKQLDLPDNRNHLLTLDTDIC